MSQAAGQDVLNSVSFAQGDWGSGGFDGVGFYTGGSVASGTAVLSGTITAMGDPVTADLNGTKTTLYAYAEVTGGAGLVLNTAGFTQLYIFLTSSLSPTTQYPLFYNFGDFNTSCLATGTRIATARGDIAVEALRIGDRLVALRHRRLAEARWIGFRVIDCAATARGHDVWPVRIAAGAFAPGVPDRDLLVSPDHALYVDGRLVPARLLLNGVTITQEPTSTVTYWHVELPCHDVILANRLPVESYLDTGNRRHFANVAGRRGTTRGVSADPAARSWPWRLVRPRPAPALPTRATSRR
jgi:hypothetical protein